MKIEKREADIVKAQPRKRLRLDAWTVILRLTYDVRLTPAECEQVEPGAAEMAAALADAPEEQERSAILKLKRKKVAPWLYEVETSEGATGSISGEWVRGELRLTSLGATLRVVSDLTVEQSDALLLIGALGDDGVEISAQPKQGTLSLVVDETDEDSTDEETELDAPVPPRPKGPPGGPWLKYRDGLFAAADLDRATRETLALICEANDLPKSGKKAELLARIRQHLAA